MSWQSEIWYIDEGILEIAPYHTIFLRSKRFQIVFENFQLSSIYSEHFSRLEVCSIDARSSVTAFMM